MEESGENELYLNTVAALRQKIVKKLIYLKK